MNLPPTIEEKEVGIGIEDSDNFKFHYSPAQNFSYRQNRKSGEVAQMGNEVEKGVWVGSDDIGKHAFFSALSFVHKWTKLLTTPYSTIVNVSVFLLGQRSLSRLNDNRR